MMVHPCNPLPPTLCSVIKRANRERPSAATPREATQCRTVAIRVDLARLTADLEQELRIALDGAVVSLVAGRIRR
jgi:hypothetical protein